MTSGAALQLRVGDGIFDVPEHIGTTEGQTSVSSWQEHYVDSEASTYADNVGESVTIAPTTTYEREQEVSQIEDHGIEHVREQFVSWIVNQRPRQAQFKMLGRRPIPIVTPFIEEVIVRDKDVRAFKEAVYRKGYAVLADEVERTIAQRRENLLNVSKEEVEALPAKRTQPKWKKQKPRVSTINQDPE